MQKYDLIKEGTFATDIDILGNVQLLKEKLKKWNKDKLSMYKMAGKRIGKNRFKIYYYYNSIYNSKKSCYEYEKIHKFAIIDINEGHIDFKFVDNTEYWRKILWTVIYPLIVLFSLLIIFGFINLDIFFKCLITAAVAAISAAVIYICYFPSYDREKATLWRDFEQLLTYELTCKK